jgi:two-component system NtrC family response regulator
MIKKAGHKRILLVDDDESFRRCIKYALKRRYHLLFAESAEQALTRLAERTPDLLLLDIMLPGMDGIDLLRHMKSSWPTIPVMMLSAVEQIPRVVESMKLGALDYLTKPITGEELLLKIEQVFTASTMKQELTQHRTLQQIIHRERRLTGPSEVLEKIRQQIRIVGKSDATVLIEGETGSGKELVARAIHACSPRAGGPFVALNCGAIPKELLEEEFFGHKKGAFTGAQTSGIGKFQLANHGTLLLDEVSDLSPQAQTKLLCVLEEQEFYPVGSNQLITVDVRVIATTNRHLKEMMEQGDFREDLFFRLNVYSLFIPPLREHPEDILPIAEYFIEHFNQYFGQFHAATVP